MKDLPQKFLIKLDDEEHSTVVQTKLFALGFKWRGYNNLDIKRLSSHTTLRIRDKDISCASDEYYSKNDFSDYVYLTLKDLIENDVDNNQNSSIVWDKNMKEINIDGEIWVVNLEKAKEQGLLSLKRERPKYYLGQRFVYQHDELTTEEYILAETSKSYKNSYVNLISLDTGMRFSLVNVLVNGDDITEEKMDEIINGDKNMQLE